MVIRTISSTNTNNEENRIAAALVGLVAGDTLQLNPGTYICQYPKKIRAVGIHLTSSDPANPARLKIMEWGENRQGSLCDDAHQGQCCGAQWNWGPGIVHAQHSHISNLIFDGSIGHLYIVAGQGCGNLLVGDADCTIEDCTFMDCINDAILLQGANNTVRSCRFLRITHECIAIGRGFNGVTTIVSNCLIENNYIDTMSQVSWHGPSGNPLGAGYIGWHNSFLRFQNVDGIIVRNNTNALRFDTTMQLPYEFCKMGTVKNVLIEKNVIQSAGQNAGVCFLACGAGETLAGANIIVQNNFFRGNQGMGGAIDVEGGVWAGITIRNNVFSASNKFGNNIHIVSGSFSGLIQSGNVLGEIVPVGVGSTLDPNPPTPGSKYSCVSGNCVVDSIGQYDTLAACQAACGGGATKYSCVSGNCVVDSVGQYDSIAACQAACGGGKMINGTFDKNTAGWVFVPMQGTGNISSVGGECKIEISTHNGWNTNMNQPGLAILPGKTYTLSFDVRSASSSPIEVYMNPDGDTYPGLLGVDVTTTPQTTKKTFQFLSGSAQGSYMVRFKFLTAGTYYIDNVALVDSEAPILKWKCLGAPSYDCIQDAEGTHATQAECKAAGCFAPCTQNWKCEVPANGYEADGCGNRRLNPACNAPCVPVWVCEVPANGYEADGCGNRRLNPACGAVDPKKDELSGLLLVVGFLEVVRRL